MLLVAGRTPATKTQNKPPRLKLRCHVFEGNYDFTKPFANAESQAHQINVKRSIVRTCIYLIRCAEAWLDAIVVVIYSEERRAQLYPQT